MKSLSHFMGQFLVFVFVGIFALLSVLQLMERGAIPWISIAGIGVIIALLAGPFVWLLRDQYSEQHRERLTLVAFGVVMIAAPITLGLALALGVPAYIPPFQALIVGGFIGFLVAFITEHTVVPERLRAAQ